jgi:glucokinase
MRVLAGDIGGTNARLAMVDIDVKAVRLLHERRFASRDFPGLAPIVRAFLADVADEPSRACFGIACPVVSGRCSATNLPWTIDVPSLAAEIGIPRTTVINDFHAVGYGVQRLSPADLVALQAGEPDERGVIALIGAGTGLGEAFLTWSGDGYRVHDSEGGHASFSARNDLEWGLLRALGSRLGHVSCERVLSGPGLVSIYRYLLASGCAEEQARVRTEMESDDPAAVIGRHALAGTDPLSTRALDIFASVYGAQAGNFALTVMATGGVYVAGGIAPRVVSRLRDGTFITAFRDKGRLSDVLARVPVHVIINPHVGLIGAAAVALHL